MFGKSTGLKDAHGIDICVGHIITTGLTINSEDKYTGRFIRKVVYWNEEYQEFWVKEVSHGLNLAFPISDVAKKILEIVGDTENNPELMH
ncbi:MAG TPA: YopX family protein [Patescibacteria group bacterium]|nr:YopX family protein [Patescibacteria group bacterium]